MDNRKEVKIRTYSDEESIAFQRKAFELGFRWMKHDTKIKNENSRTWWVEWYNAENNRLEEKYISYGGSVDEWFEEYGCPEVTLDDFLRRGIKVFDRFPSDTPTLTKVIFED